MNNPVLMCMVNGRANCLEQPQAVRDRQPVMITIARDRLAIDVLHHEIRIPVFGIAAVEQPRDVGMIEVRQDLTFATEAPK